jgi:GT2 family glycosyltransferase
MPNRDNAGVLDMVLDKLARHTQYPNFELLVIDDGSTDGSREILRRWQASGQFNEFQLLEREHTAQGVVAALNAGLEAATGELVVQLDADASVETPGWLETMVDFILSDTRIGVVTTKVVTDGGELQTCGINVLGREGYHDRGSEISEEVGKRTSHQKVKRFREGEWPDSERIAEVDGGMGACMIYRRGAALEIGGYDPGFAPVWLDDVDLTIALRRRGMKVFYLPQVRVVHHLGKRVRPDDQTPGPGQTQRAARGIRKAVGRALPGSARVALVRTFGWDRGPRWYRRRVAGHYRHWQEKWGWDMLNPDMRSIDTRWGQTEICWRTNPEMLRAGEAIIATFTAMTRG